jgi:hypothetical protein
MCFFYLALEILKFLIGREVYLLTLLSSVARKERRIKKTEPCLTLDIIVQTVNLSFFIKEDIFIL